MTVATAMGVCSSTMRKWAGRFKAEGVSGLQDRSSQPSGAGIKHEIPTISCLVPVFDGSDRD
jgi:hypothetical protein